MAGQLLGAEGVASKHGAEAAGAFRAIECLIQEDASVVAPVVIPHIEALLDRQQAEALSPADLRIFETPEGGES